MGEVAGRCDSRGLTRAFKVGGSELANRMIPPTTHLACYLPTEQPIDGNLVRLERRMLTLCIDIGFRIVLPGQSLSDKSFPQNSGKPQIFDLLQADRAMST